MFTVKANFIRYGEWNTTQHNTLDEVVAKLKSLDNRFEWHFSSLTKRIIRAKTEFYTVNISTQHAQAETIAELKQVFG